MEGKFDVFYAYSVFSHLRGDDSRFYLQEVNRLLNPTGFAFVTAFIERDVPNETENPIDYGSIKWIRPLHCVRYEHHYFDAMVRDAGLRIDHFEHGKETDGQSLLVLRSNHPA